MYTISKQYDVVPLIYDHIMANLDYDSWGEYLLQIIEDYSVVSKNVLEIAAGTGKIANILHSKFPLYLTTDLSLAMLKTNTNKRLKKVCCDMTMLPFKNKFDVIICIFDSINYLTSVEKLLSFFKEIRNSLSDDGIFTFDAALEQNSIKHAKVFNISDRYKDIRYTQKSTYDNKTKMHKNIFTFVFEDGNEIIEIHKQKIYPFELYFKLIDKAGLYVADCFDAFSFDRGTPDSDRIQFILKKNNYADI
ncbi:MAG: class I SAM-dependent methyltransferase [Bacteroidota bacterium]|nr:class I SAM-dependent methyltransferase [Bacteroidota bacterium]